MFVVVIGVLSHVSSEKKLLYVANTTNFGDLRRGELDQLL